MNFRQGIVHLPAEPDVLDGFPEGNGYLSRPWRSRTLKRNALYCRQSFRGCLFRIRCVRRVSSGAISTTVLRLGDNRR